MSRGTHRCDGQSTNCDWQPIDNAWYFWALNSTTRISKAVQATRSGGEVTMSQLQEMESRKAALSMAFDHEFWDTSCSCYRSTQHRTRPGGGATTNCLTKKDNCIGLR